MLSALRETLLGNWRNKGVAMFFAVTIWYVAYRSELMVDDATVRVEITSRQPEMMVIQAQSARPDGRLERFSGEVRLQLNGSRKEIDTFKKSLPQEIKVKVDSVPGPEPYSKKFFFSAKDFNLPNIELVEIQRFDPEMVELALDRRETLEVKVGTDYPNTSQGLEKDLEKVEPAVVPVTGPSSILKRIQVVGIVDRTFNDFLLRFEGKVPLKVLPETLDGLSTQSLVRIQIPNEAVGVTVQFRLKQATLEEEVVRVRFLVPPVGFPFHIKFEERTIPITFQGPEREIQILRERVKDPDFFVAVPVPSTELSPDRESTFTFTEDQLLLFDFSKEVQKLQHRSRKEKGLVAWSYSIVPLEPGAEKGS